MKPSLADRAEEFQRIAEEQSGLVPYDNTRALGVKGGQDGILLSDFLKRLSGWQTTEQQTEGLKQGRVLVDGKSQPLSTALRAGSRVEVVFRNVVEPRVATEMCVLHEDASLMVLVKPAPLPVHPSGRYNRHTLTEIAKRAWPDVTLKPVHRLDAATGGLIVMGKNAEMATRLVQIFANHEIEKRYAARIHGHPDEDVFTIDFPIGKGPGAAGVREIRDGGAAAVTHVEVRSRLDDGTSVLWCFPKTGRTNQIRLHLKALGFPIVGDRAYGEGVVSGEGFANSSDRLHLFACGLKFIHPLSGERMVFEIDPPPAFGKPRGNHP